MDLKKNISFRELFEKVCCADRKKLLIFLYIGSLAVNLIYTFSKGVYIMGYEGTDYDSYFFINAADMLFSDFGAFAEKYAGMPYYWFYIVFLGIYQAIFGKNYLLLIIIQSVLSAFSVPVLYLAAEKVSDDRRIHFLSAFLYMLCLSTARWSRLVGSDFLGAGFMPVCLYFLFSYLNDEKKSRKKLALLLLSLALFFTMRTTAPPFIVCAIIAVIFSFGKKARAVFGTLAAAAAVCFISLLLIPGSDAAHTLNENLSFFLSLYKSGEIVKKLYIYIYAVTSDGSMPDLVSCLVMIFYRFFYYWTAIDVGVNNGRAYPQTMYAILHYLPNLYVFSSMFLGMIIRKFRKDSESKRIGLISCCIWCSCFVQILCEINEDWRYRDIIMPMCFIVCAYGTIKFYDMLKNQTGTEDEKCSMNS